MPSSDVARMSFHGASTAEVATPLDSLHSLAGSACGDLFPSTATRSCGDMHASAFRDHNLGCHQGPRGHNPDCHQLPQGSTGTGPSGLVCSSLSVDRSSTASCPPSSSALGGAANGEASGCDECARQSECSGDCGSVSGNESSSQAQAQAQTQNSLELSKRRKLSSGPASSSEQALTSAGVKHGSFLKPKLSVLSHFRESLRRQATKRQACRTLHSDDAGVTGAKSAAEESVSRRRWVSERRTHSQRLSTGVLDRRPVASFEPGPSVDKVPRSYSDLSLSWRALAKGPRAGSDSFTGCCLAEEGSPLVAESLGEDSVESGFLRPLHAGTFCRGTPERLAATSRQATPSARSPGSASVSGLLPSSAVLRGSRRVDVVPVLVGEGLSRSRSYSPGEAEGLATAALERRATLVELPEELQHLGSMAQDAFAKWIRSFRKLKDERRDEEKEEDTECLLVASPKASTVEQGTRGTSATGAASPAKKGSIRARWHMLQPSTQAGGSSAKVSAEHGRLDKTSLARQSNTQEQGRATVHLSVVAPAMVVEQVVAPSIPVLASEVEEISTAGSTAPSVAQQQPGQPAIVAAAVGGNSPVFVAGVGPSSSAQPRVMAVGAVQPVVGGNKGVRAHTRLGGVTTSQGARAHKEEWIHQQRPGAVSWSKFLEEVQDVLLGFLVLVALVAMFYGKIPPMAATLAIGLFASRALASRKPARKRSALKITVPAAASGSGSESGSLTPEMLPEARTRPVPADKEAVRKQQQIAHILQYSKTTDPTARSVLEGFLARPRRTRGRR